MEIIDLLGIGIVGAAISFTIEALKARFGNDATSNKAYAVGLSVVIGGAYYFLRDTQALVTIVGVLGVSQTIYGLILKK